MFLTLPRSHHGLYNHGLVQVVLFRTRRRLGRSSRNHHKLRISSLADRLFIFLSFSPSCCGYPKALTGAWRKKANLTTAKFGGILADTRYREAINHLLRWPIFGVIFTLELGPRTASNLGEGRPRSLFRLFFVYHLYISPRADISSHLARHFVIVSSYL